MKEEELLHTFYQAFQNRDFKTMASCYHEDACFKDEVFKLQGKEINAMWHMLCERAKDFSLTYSINKKDQEYEVIWVAKYTFSQTGRFVENKITAKFEFKNGKISKHQDTFDFWCWNRQALGMPGYLIGWSSFFRKKVKLMAGKNLNTFIGRHPEYRSA